jgi:hypothetical protein
MAVLVETEPGAIVIEVAFETFHDKVEVPAGATTAGLAVKEMTGGLTFASNVAMSANMTIGVALVNVFE